MEEWDKESVPQAPLTSSSSRWNSQLPSVKEGVEFSDNSPTESTARSLKSAESTVVHSPGYSQPTESEVEKAIVNLFGQDRFARMEKHHHEKETSVLAEFAPKSPNSQSNSARKLLGKEITPTPSESFRSSLSSLLREGSERSQESRSEIVAEEEEQELHKSASVKGERQSEQFSGGEIGKSK